MTASMSSVSCLTYHFTYSKNGLEQRNLKIACKCWPNESVFQLGDLPSLNSNSWHFTVPTIVQARQDLSQSPPPLEPYCVCAPLAGHIFLSLGGLTVEPQETFKHHHCRPLASGMTADKPITSEEPIPLVDSHFHRDNVLQS
jgi:hypothetical protein